MSQRTNEEQQVAKFRRMLLEFLPPTKKAKMVAALKQLRPTNASTKSGPQDKRLTLDELAKSSPQGEKLSQWIKRETPKLQSMLLESLPPKKKAEAVAALEQLGRMDASTKSGQQGRRL